MPFEPLNPFEIPQWSVPHDAQMGLLRVAIILAIGSFFYAIWFARREKSLFPLYLFFGAGFAVLYEPLGDILTKVAYPPVDQVSLMTSFGRPTPLWMLPNYFFFFCAPVLLLLQFVVKPNVSAKKWWIAYAITALAVGLFEQPGIIGDQWRYYSANQAFSINSYPVWVAFANAQSLFVIASGIYLLRRSVLTERQNILLLLFVPTIFVASHVGATLPIVSALYTTSNLVIVNCAALMAIAMCILNMWLAFTLLRNSQKQNQA